MQRKNRKKEVSMEVRERYVNFYTDFAFKKLFGTEANKDLLISFLNALFDGKEEIKDLAYLNGEHLGHAVSDRKAVFDVYCENSKGEKFLIEMQKAEQEYFKDRSIYYSTFPIQEQAPQGKWDFKQNKVYVLCILNFCLGDSPSESMQHEVKLMYTCVHRVFYDKLTYIYLEMPKFTKTEAELKTTFDKWLYSIKNLCYLLERPQALQEAVFQRFFTQAEILKFSSEEQYAYRESQKDYWDFYSVTETAEKKGRKAGLLEGLEKGLKKGHKAGLKEGRAEGLEQGLKKGHKAGLEEGKEIGMQKGRKEGMAEGRKQERLQMARKLKASDISIETILKITGLNAAEIEEL